MLDTDLLNADLASLGLGHWQTPLQSMLEERLSERAHGSYSDWQRAVDRLPVREGEIDLDRSAVFVDCPADVAAQCQPPLLELTPWRKGPFRLGELTIDSEWRSDMKWRRLREHIDSLEGRSVLDVGCGNGYYSLRMYGMGARAVIGIDPTILYVVQHAAIRRFMPRLPVHVLPLRLHELPSATGVFDTTFSMGVLYHQRDPLQHLAQLRDTLRHDGQLVLETLILPGDLAEARTPDDRYARMRNVWLLPTVPQLEKWVSDSGFDDIRVIDISLTTPDEQRSTEWMPFESLAEALDPNDSSRTIEGWPAPRRALLLCRR